LWRALTTLDDDIMDVIWDVIASLPERRVSRELDRLYALQRDHSD
jgi:hypothetical protein